jgi:hypothetical protein
MKLSTWGYCTAPSGVFGTLVVGYRLVVGYPWSLDILGRWMSLSRWMTLILFDAA